jgi:hypothetical protein
MNRFGKFCRETYYGMSPRALRAQYLFLTLDLLIISYFVVTRSISCAGLRHNTIAVHSSSGR